VTTPSLAGRAADVETPTERAYARQRTIAQTGAAIMRSLTTPAIWRAVLAIVVGIIAIAWPDITVWAFVILFAIYAFVAAAIEAARAFSSRTAGPVAGHLLLAVIDVAAGVVALAWPDITALALALIVAVWAFVAGFVELYLAFTSGHTAGERALLGLTGLILIALGVVFARRPDVAAVTIAEVYGLFSIVWGISALVIALNVRRAARIVGMPGTHRSGQSFEHDSAAAAGR
jgi:uncharacterized membrane protein HdeD (DUF308 family)